MFLPLLVAFSEDLVLAPGTYIKPKWKVDDHRANMKEGAFLVWLPLWRRASCQVDCGR